MTPGVAPTPSEVHALAEGVQDEMMAAMLSFSKGAAAACADICTNRLSLMYAQLIGQNIDIAGMRRGGDDPMRAILGSSMNGLGDSRHAMLIRSIRQRLQAQGETPEMFFRQRAAMGRGLVSREDFISGLSALSLGASGAEFADLFRHIVNGSDRIEALLEEIVTGLEAPHSGAFGTTQIGGATPAEAEQVLGRVRSAVSRSQRPLDEVFRGFCRSNSGAPGVMSRSDLKRVLSTFEPGLNPDVVAKLWRALVPDGAPGLDYQTFAAWFSPGGRSFNSGPYPSSYSAGESGMLSQLLEMSVASPLSQSLPAGGMNGLFPPSPTGGYAGSQQARDNATIAALSAPQNSLSQTLPPRNARY